MNRIRKLIGGSLVTLLLVSTACAHGSASNAQVRSIALPTEARATLPELCGDIHALACKPENATVAQEDMMTVVATKIREQKPELKALMDGIVSVPAAERREVFKRSISDALGSEWVCPDFDKLWDSQPVSCE